MTHWDYRSDYDDYPNWPLDYPRNRRPTSYPSRRSNSLPGRDGRPTWLYAMRAHRQRNDEHDPPEANDSKNLSTKSLSKASGQEGKKTVKKRVTTKASNFAELTTVAGLIWIKNATSWTARAFWILAFLGMLAVLVWHLYFIFNRYYSYPFSTKISVKSTESVAFPSVTVCNLNPIRSSELYRDPDLESFVQYIQAAYENEISYSQEEADDEDADADYGDETDEGMLRRRRRKRQAGDTPNFDFYGGGGYYDNYTDYYDYDDYDYDDDDDGSEFGGTTDPSFIIDRTFKTLIGEIDPSTRKEMGHQRSLMILKCTFNGKTCFANNFTHSFSGTYGNCYTFNSATVSNSSYITRFVGPKNGLSLQLYVEEYNYLAGFTQGQGFRVSIHQFGALPFPEELGYSIPAGMETFVGLRREEYSRLNEPYKKCEDGKDFDTKYRAKYTKKSCTALCADALTAMRCQCYVGHRIEYYPSALIDTLPRCEDEGSTCAAGISNAVLIGNATCDCERACSTTQFSRQISSNVWPDVGVYNMLGTLLCSKDDAGEHCQAMVSQASDPAVEKAFILRSDFAKLNVFYSDLNYQEVTEEADYPLENFAADIGGVIGLWLGLSVFSVIEIVMLVWALCKILAPKKKNTPSLAGSQSKPVNYSRSALPRVTRPALAYHPRWEYDRNSWENVRKPERY